MVFVRTLQLFYESMTLLTCSMVMSSVPGKPAGPTNFFLDALLSTFKLYLWMLDGKPISLIEVNIYCCVADDACSPGGSGELTIEDFSVAGPKSAALPLGETSSLPSSNTE